MTIEISAALVKELRDITGSGMMSCKQALVETNGNIEEAVDWLRKKGLASASKKAGRVTAEGIVSVKADASHGVIIETNSETDFVSRNDKFIEFVSHTTDLVFDKGITSVDDLLKLEYEPSKTIKDKLTELISVIGENLHIRRIGIVRANGHIASYVHNTIIPNLGKIGVLVGFESDCSNKAALQEIGKFISMHIAASTALLALSHGEIDPDIAKRERAILLDKASQSGKPAAIVEKIVEGGMAKFFKESALLEQPFFVDPDKTIQQVLDNFAKKESCSIKISKYIRFILGEGVEKEHVDFAKEVMEQVKK